MNIGVYIHIPFCQSRCKYCDFFSTTLLDRQHLYVNAVIKEWEQRVSTFLPNRSNESGGSVPTIKTIYIGGGTPSTLAVSDIKKIIQRIATPDTQEITLEANPGDLTLSKLQELRQAGINRLSIGVQSFRNPLLRTIGRRHTARQARLAIKWAQKAGFDNVSIDLMFGLPRQNMLQWAMDVKKAIRLEVQHISCYCLTYEDGTPLKQMLDKREIRPTSERMQNKMYNYLCRVLTRNGYEHYEVSNFAVPGFRSQHNSAYWDGTPYIGLGAGAHSYDGQTRSWNPSDLDAYIHGINDRTLQPESETLTDEQKKMERIMLALRTKEGVDLKEVSDKQEQVQHYIARGMLRQEKTHIIATQQGLNILNRIIEDLI